MKYKEHDVGWRSAVKGYISVLGIMIAALFFIYFRSHVMTRIIVSGDSMDPSYKNGDVVFLLECGIKIQRYDTVVARTQWGDLIKRVVGLPGDTILIRDGTVYVNGDPVDDKYAFETSYAGVAEECLTVSQDCYFLLGDNRSVSRDSRDFGEIKKDQIRGKVVFRIFPPAGRR